MQPSHFRPAGLGPIFFSAGPREAAKPGAAGGSRLAAPRSCAAASSPVPALDPAGDGRPLGYHVDWSITWLPARRRDGFGLRSCRARRPAGTRSATAVQHWPSFFASEKPSGKRCDARGPSRNRPTVAPPMPRTEGKLPRNAVRDKRWRRSACGCKITLSLRSFLAKNAMAAFSAAMVAFNYVDPTFSEQRLGRGEVFPAYRPAYRRVIQDDAPGHPVCPGGEKPMHKLGPWPGTFFM
jgi:hypothetical protein